jgi:signal transduction histidine kinase
VTASPPGDWRHELKNQLGIVLGFSELLLQEMPKDDPRRTDVAEIHAAAARAMELVNEGRKSDAG